MTEIFIVRHGQTDWNLEGRIQGNLDIPLNFTGIRQSKVFAESIIAEHYDAVFSSDLQRAIQTARIIADWLQIPVISDMRLREVNHGAWEGMLIRDVRSHFNEEYVAFRSDQPGGRPPGGETLREASARIEAAVEEFAGRHPYGRFVLASHGLALAILRCRLNHAPLSLTHQFGLENCAGEMIHWEKKARAE